MRAQSKFVLAAGVALAVLGGAAMLGTSEAVAQMTCETYTTKSGQSRKISCPRGTRCVQSKGCSEWRQNRGWCCAKR